MENSKLQIYKGIIQFLLENTHFTLINIADLSNSSIKSIHSIYYDNLIPPDFQTESGLVQLYQLALELKSKQR